MIPRITSAVTVLAIALVLTACSAGPEAPGAKATPATDAPAPEASIEPDETDAPPDAAAEPTCESIISDGTVKALTDAGWTFEEKEFRIGDVALPDGILCFWADYTVASDHGQLYGWAEIASADAATAQSTLLAEGWTREEGPEGVYITEDPQYAMGTDEEGYGMTYLFGDGWVELADTRQGLILIEWEG